MLNDSGASLCLFFRSLPGRILLARLLFGVKVRGKVSMDYENVPASVHKSCSSDNKQDHSQSLCRCLQCQGSLHRHHRGSQKPLVLGHLVLGNILEIDETLSCSIMILRPSLTPRCGPAAAHAAWPVAATRAEQAH
jgi:hypothetical protein